jgi:hypothetical protein
MQEHKKKPEKTMCAKMLKPVTVTCFLIRKFNTGHAAHSQEKCGGKMMPKFTF